MTSPEHNDAARTELIELHLLRAAVTHQVTELGLLQLNMRPHLQHMRVHAINELCATDKSYIGVLHQPCFHDNLHDDPRHCEGRDVGVVGVRVVCGGDGPVFGLVEGSVCHEDVGLVGGGAVSGDRHYLFSHLVHIDLEGGREGEEEEEEGGKGRRRKEEGEEGGGRGRRREGEGERGGRGRRGGREGEGGGRERGEERERGTKGGEKEEGGGKKAIWCD